MPKRADQLETLRLALELLKRIPKGRTITATELRMQLEDAGFEREPRTIQRLLENLSEYFDIDRDDSTKPYLYTWKDNAEGLSLPGLSTQESLLLTLAEQQLRNLLPVKLMNSMEGFFKQARGTLDAKVSAQRERQWLDKVRVVSTSQPLLPPKVNTAVFAQVSDALYNNYWLDVGYKNAAGKSTNARVMPLGIAQQGPRMYVICRYEGYDNERSLALHRMTSATSTNFTFERPKDFNLKKFDDDGRFGYGDGKKIRLIFNIDKNAGLHIVECPLSADQKVVEVEDAYKITATVVDSAMLDWWLRGFGDGIYDVSKAKSIK